MDAKTILGVVEKLVGPVTPAGSSHIDADRLANMKTLIELMKELHVKVDGIATDYKSRPEYSVQQIWKCANEYLNWLGIPE